MAPQETEEEEKESRRVEAESLNSPYVSSVLQVRGHIIQGGCSRYKRNGRELPPTRSTALLPPDRYIPLYLRPSPPLTPGARARADEQRRRMLERRVEAPE